MNPAPTIPYLSKALGHLLGQNAVDALHHALNNTKPPAGTAGIKCSNGGRSSVFIFDGINPKLHLDSKYVLRVPNLKQSYGDAVDMQQRLKDVYSILGLTDCVPLVMAARTAGLYVVVTLSSYYGRNAYEAVDSSELTLFLLLVRIQLANSKLAYGDRSLKNSCWRNGSVVFIDHDETLVNPELGKNAWFDSAITFLFTCRKEDFDTIHHDLLIVPIEGLFHKGSLKIDTRSHDAGIHGALVAPLVVNLAANLRIALCDAAKAPSRAIRSFLEQFVSINMEYIFKFIKLSGRPFHK
jgi:hypothetical protein